MKTLILAGGLGTRLQPIVADRPKPMAQVGGKPFLEYLIERLRAQGLGDFVFCVGHRAQRIWDYFGDGTAWNVSVDYAVETDLLGTAGAIKNAGAFVDDTFLVLNGDTYLDVGLQAMVDFHHRQRSAEPPTLGTLAAVPVDDAAASGVLELDEQGRILGFQEKTQAGPGWINGGIYVLEPELLDMIPQGRAVSLEKETFPLILERGYRLLSYPAGGFFVDIGTPEGYRRFVCYVKEQDCDHPQ
jgi:NDP-sugar pyrophosphorylase family protein